jgi:hypothetical protein
MFILGWTPRGLTTASATAFLGPRPDSSKFWGGIVSLAARFRSASARGAKWSSPSSIGVGLAFAIKYSFVLGGARHQPLIHE